MVTIGRGILDEAVFELFEGLRTFDAQRAVASLAPDVAWEDPWHGRLDGRDAVAARLTEFLGDVEKRPSWTIMDVTGKGPIVHMLVSVSGRFGRGPRPHKMSVLVTKGRLHQVIIRPA